MRNTELARRLIYRAWVLWPRNPNVLELARRINRRYNRNA